jgi:hypothetical protein
MAQLGYRQASRNLVIIFKKENPMIENKEIARKLSKLMLDTASCLNDFLFEVQAKCSEEDFKKSRLAIGSILATMATEVLNPLYREHPDIKPEGYYLPGVSKPEL